MIISIAVKKPFSTGLFLQFTFSYSITTAKIEQYVSDMLKKTLSRLLQKYFEDWVTNMTKNAKKKNAGRIKPYGFQLSDWLEAMFRASDWDCRYLWQVCHSIRVWHLKQHTRQYNLLILGKKMVATVLPTGFESRHRHHMWVSQEVSPVGYSSCSLSTKK